MRLNCRHRGTRKDEHPPRRKGTVIETRVEITDKEGIEKKGCLVVATKLHTCLYFFQIYCILRFELKSSTALQSLEGKEILTIHVAPHYVHLAPLAFPRQESYLKKPYIVLSSCSHSSLD